ncbi:hypothetical protein Ddye_003425 [Dipteronia dyeriana]|uniref:non-specific serine/threonine protein kinase n=1 Tax=Dipteronia dyeriana TaxID=168575 RepID=A0AAD9XSV6_9ROSI|nr:hypothetical protein Ddye_003425 [Dipteronia dyeriana]
MLLLTTSAPNIGNSIYRAPEMDQANSKINEKVDIFSLGIIFFEMLCHFKTGMERIKCIEALKEKKEFPKTWTGNEASEDFVLELISIAPGARPSTFEILNRHPWDVTER